jgi:NAD(P)H-flavin reductase
MRIINSFYGEIESITCINANIYLLKVKLQACEYFISKAGQYVYLNNGKFWQPYSIASSPAVSTLEFFIKGNVQIAPFIRMYARGEKVSISKPQGHACIKENYKNYLCIAVGVAISPILSIASYVKVKGIASKLHVIWLPSSLQQLEYFMPYFTGSKFFAFDYILNAREIDLISEIKLLAYKFIDKTNSQCFIYGSPCFVRYVYNNLNGHLINIATDVKTG